MRISMPRGDIRIIPFTITSPDGEISDIDFTEIYFTVKRKYSDSEYCFQKRLSSGGIVKNDVGYYQIKIMPEDTEGMTINKSGEFYDFDIQLVYRDEIKETTCGEFVLTKEVTHKNNEV